MISTTHSQMTGLESIDAAVQSFEQLTTDEKLGLLWVLYDNMGDTITPAAPGAAGEQFTQNLLQTVKDMAQNQQLAFMRDLVNHTQTDHTAEYSTFTQDGKLVFWYELAELMRTGEVIPMPPDYQLSQKANQVFSSISGMEFNEQITLLRHAVMEMGVA